MEQPLVSVLIPVYNAAATIGAAIESCLLQTYGNTEVIVLDDASTDSTIEKIVAHTKVRCIRNVDNKGTASARNRLLQEAKGEYITWLDADDTMVPERISKQVDFLQTHPETDIVGSWIKTDHPSLPYKKFPTDPAIIKAHLWFRNCMAQPSVMSRNFYAKEDIWYNEEFRFMQDYELWFRLRNKKGFANIPAFLTAYHVSSEEETRLKHLNADQQLPKQLWTMKWKEGTFGLSDEHQLALQYFLGSNGRISSDMGKVIKEALDTLKRDAGFSSNRENRVILHFYRLLLWKRLDPGGRISQWSLCISLRYYFKLKGLYLIQ